MGATLAYAMLIRGVAEHVALYDLDSAKVRAEVLDLRHGLQFVPQAEVSGSDDIDICAGADVVVVTAGAKQKPGQTRLDLAGVNVAMCRSLVPQLVEVASNAVIVMVTNPVDVLTYAAVKIAGLPEGRVFGSGTVLDSSRLRQLIARRTGVAVQNVHAWIAGEHGDSELPLWSSASIGSISLERFALPGRSPLDDPAKEQIATDVVSSAEQVIRGKGATNYAVGLATSRIIEAVLRGQNHVLPVSTLLHHYQGLEDLEDVCLSVPCVINRGGVGSVLEVPLSEAEARGLCESARAIRAVARSLGL